MYTVILQDILIIQWSIIPKTGIFSEEDADLVSQQAGVDREKARNALIEANRDLAKAILLLTTG